MLVKEQLIDKERGLKIQKKEGELYFVHLTFADNIESIKKEGLRLSDDTTMFSEECLYCVDAEDFAGTESLGELSEDYTHDCDDSMALVFGYYTGEYFEVVGCIDDEEENSYALRFIGLLEKDKIKLDKYMEVKACDVGTVIKDITVCNPREFELAAVGNIKLETKYFRR